MVLNTEFNNISQIADHLTMAVNTEPDVKVDDLTSQLRHFRAVAAFFRGLQIQVIS